MPNFTVCTSRFSPCLFHGLCAFFVSNSWFMRLFQAPLDTCLDSPLLCQPLSSRVALHGLHALDHVFLLLAFVEVSSLGHRGMAIAIATVEMQCAE